MITVKCKDLSEGYFKLNDALFFENLYDHERNGVTAHKFDIRMESDSPACTLNLHDLNYTMNKWKMLNNLYLNPEEIGVFVGRINHYRGQKKHKNYIPDIAMQFQNRRNVSGACLLAITMGYHNGEWHSTVTTRASELTCRWPMDLIFVNVLLRDISEYLEIDYLKIRVHWNMVSTYQSITSMPYYLVLAGHEDWFEAIDPEKLGELTPWQLSTYKRYHKCFLNDNYGKYRVQRRPMEAYRMLKGTMERKQLIWTEDLHIGIIPFKGTFEDDYDETDLCMFTTEAMAMLEKQAIEKDLWGKGGYR